MESSVQPVGLLKPGYVFAVLGWLLLSGSTASPALDPAVIRDVTIPYYSRGGSSPAAVVRIKRLFTDYQRRGFFRIGLLPMLVAEGVRIEILQPEETLAALQGAQKWLHSRAARKGLEWRDVQFHFQTEAAPRLEATRLQLSDDGAWRLTDGVVFRLGTNEWRQLEAILQVTGPKAGELLMRSDGAERLHLLQHLSEKRTTE